MRCCAAGLPPGARRGRRSRRCDSRQIWIDPRSCPNLVHDLGDADDAWPSFVVGQSDHLSGDLGAAGLMGSVIRGNGAPGFVVILAFLLVMRVGREGVVACLAAFVVRWPPTGDLLLRERAAQHHQQHRVFLWSRTMRSPKLRRDSADATWSLCPGEPARSPAAPARPGSCPRCLVSATPATYLCGPGRLVQGRRHPGVNARNTKRP